MKKHLFALAALSLIFACTPENNNNGGTKESTIPAGAVDLGIEMTRTDGTTYKLYWAKSNLSDKGLCTNPEDYGDYYAWGETAPKENYSWSTYKFGTSKSGPFSKYNTISSYGSIDNKTVLEPEDDVASVKLGGKWRMPTDEEWRALKNNCTVEETFIGMTFIGITLTSKVPGYTDKSILLPASGWQEGTSRKSSHYVYYWSSSLNTRYPYSASYAEIGLAGTPCSPNRSFGLPIRPVSE